MGTYRTAWGGGGQVCVGGGGGWGSQVCVDGGGMTMGKNDIESQHCTARNHSRTARSVRP